MKDIGNNIHKLPRLLGENFVLRLLSPEEALLMLNYRLYNKEHLASWEPIRPPEWDTLQFWKSELRRFAINYNKSKELRLAMLLLDESEVIGICKFTNIIKGAFKACNLGFSIDKRYEGQGLAFEALQMAIPYTFKQFRLHRIMANYMPQNMRCSKLLRRLGFEEEGYARSYIKIAGKWEDFILTSLINNDET